MGNQSYFNDFVLVGFVNFETYSLAMFIISFIIYIMTISGNVLIILVVYYHANLHNPMYFFIANLSFLEIWSVSTTTPKLLAMLLTNNKRISFHWCFVQLYVFCGFGITECYSLTIMSIDRFVAICKPLRYNTIMTGKVCTYLTSICWILGFSEAIIPTSLTSQVPFCGKYVNHYFCDLAPLLSLSCGDITLTVTINSYVSGFTTMFSLGTVVVMYINIIIAIMKLRSNTRRMKAFTTCSSHITVVILFFGTAFMVYSSPKDTQSKDYDKMIALVYVMLIPFLNPFIYSLRNKEVMSGLKRGFQKISFRSVYNKNKIFSILRKHVV